MWLDFYKMEKIRYSRVRDITRKRFIPMTQFTTELLNFLTQKQDIDEFFCTSAWNSYEWPASSRIVSLFRVWALTLLECLHKIIYSIELRFKLVLPNVKTIPTLVTKQNMKGLQSSSMTEIDLDTGKRHGQSALDQWLLVDVLGLQDRTLVTREWLQKKGTDSIRLWHVKDDYSTIYIDFAPIGSFEKFMSDEAITPDDDYYNPNIARNLYEYLRRNLRHSKRLHLKLWSLTNKKFFRRWISTRNPKFWKWTF